MKQSNNFLLLGKSLFFPHEGILAIGDLHIGYERMLKTHGFEFPINQIKETEKELEKIFDEIKKRKMKLKKIVILGDLKHFFNFDISEKYEVRRFLEFLENIVGKGNIILLKGNHEKIFLDNREYMFFHIEKNGIAFTHGDKLHKEILNKNVKTIVMGHLHPAVYIRDEKSHKKEKYKCFLVGKWKKKNIIIVPSFLQLREGTDILTEYKDDAKWSFIRKSQLLKFHVFVPDIENNKVYDFGVLKKLKR